MFSKFVTTLIDVKSGTFIIIGRFSPINLLDMKNDNLQMFPFFYLTKRSDAFILSRSLTNGHSLGYFATL